MQIEQINQPMSDLASQAWSDPCVYVATQLKKCNCSIAMPLYVV